MIAFTCGHCGLKLTVKDEFAGRQSACPTCKQRLVVPIPDRAPPNVPTERIDGLLSSLSRAGVDAGVTLGDAATGNPATPQRSVRTLLERRGKTSERYLIENEIARGGMGAVLRAVDCDIRREVAVKYLLDQADLRRKARFVEEAQITGQLEHPNIVPIHELGIDAQKRLFFSMKMVKGRSLAQALDALRQVPKAAEREFSPTRLLTALVNVCHALAYAHSRGVVHRDLKPANIMLGDFGEVYVMDWGLAKVLASGGCKPPGEAQVAEAQPGGLHPPLAKSSKVVTSRDGDADLTQDGAVLGTPAYMPPEQAMGKVAAIDLRSDVYSLGAILYEMLTLQPPVDKEGGYLGTLMRVSRGEIAPPEVRVPERARAGKVPKELAAVAMKALALNPADRYPSVEAFRQDIERFLEGRSVSAKADSTREMLWKLLRRNKAVSAASVIFLVLLMVAFGFTLKNYLAFAKEQKDKEARTRQAVPAFVRAARLAINERQFDDALAQVDVALDFDRNYAEAHLLKGQLLIVRRDYLSARMELEKYLKQKPQDQAAAKLAELCGKARTDDGTVMAFVEAFTEQRLFALADGVTTSAAYGNNAVQARNQILALYRKRINAAWPGVGAQLQMRPNGSMVLDLRGYEQVSDLSPLRGMALTSLDLGRCKLVRDLAPLQGMPLTSLALDGCDQVRDLSALQGMKLTNLNLFNCRQVGDLSPLRGMPLTELDLSGCKPVRDLSPLREMKLTSLKLFSCGQVADLSPLQGMPITNFNLSHAAQLRDLSPLRGMPLTHVQLVNCPGVRNLAPLKGMKLVSLDVSGCGPLQDLTALRGMPLAYLNLDGCGPGLDLKSIRELPLSWLNVARCQLADLSPLKGMKLVGLDLASNPVADLSLLQGMPLTGLSLNYCQKINPAQLKGLRLTSVSLIGSNVTDLSVLDGMDLKDIYLPLRADRGTLVLRRMKNLATINNVPVKTWWAGYDAGEFKQFKP